MLSISRIAIASISLLPIITAHTVITYPGWRGNNLHTNGTSEDTLGINGVPTPDTNGDLLWPFGMQWEYPCTSSLPPHNMTDLSNLKTKWN